MTNSFLARILRPTALFAVLLIALMVVSTAFAQTGVAYTLTATDVVCGDAALTQNCGTFSGVAVTYVDAGNGVVQIFNQSGVAAGFMKAPVAAPAVVYQPDAATRTVNFNFGGMWKPIGDRIAEIWAYGLFHALFIVGSIVAMALMPPVENQVERRAFLNSYFVSFVIKVAVLVLIQFLVLNGKLDWAINYLVLWTHQQWIPGAFNYVIGICTAVYIYFGLRLILDESGTSMATDSNSEPEPMHFASEAARKAFMDNDMPKKHLSSGGMGYNPKADEPYWLVVRQLVQEAKQDKSYMAATLFLIWVVLEVFGTFIVSIPTSFVRLDVFDVFLAAAVYFLWGPKQEIFNELGSSWMMVFQTLFVGIIVGGMYVLLLTMAHQTSTSYFWSALRFFPYEASVLFLPGIYLALQGKGSYVTGTTDILSGVLTLAMLAIQFVPNTIFG